MFIFKITKKIIAFNNNNEIRNTSVFYKYLTTYIKNI